MTEQFQASLNNITHYSNVGFVLALAKDVGILDELLTSDTPKSAGYIANVRKLKKRYVQEILGCLVSAGLVQVSFKEKNFYHMGRANREFLRQVGVMQRISFVSALVEAYKPVRDCVLKEGPFGVGYGGAMYRLLDYRNMAATEAIVELMIQAVPGLKFKLMEGIRVAEFGCGSGRLISSLATRFPSSAFTGSEYRADLVVQMKSSWGYLPNVRFEVFDLCQSNPNPDRKLDWIYVIDVIHYLPYPLTALKVIRALMKDAGSLFMSVEMTGNASHLVPAEKTGRERPMGDAEYLEDAGSLEDASVYALSTFLSLPERNQRVNRDVFGSCWSKKTAVDIYTMAGFKVRVQDIDGAEGRKTLLICEPAPDRFLRIDANESVSRKEKKTTLTLFK